MHVKDVMLAIQGIFTPHKLDQIRHAHAMTCGFVQYITHSLYVKTVQRTGCIHSVYENCTFDSHAMNTESTQFCTSALISLVSVYLRAG
jgi:hypothetical protein